MEKEAKEVQKSTGDKNLNLFIFNRLKEGVRPSNICKELGIKKTAIQYYLSSLKENGFIKKIGYGTWEILKDYDKNKFKKSTAVANINRDKFELLKPDSVRGHAFQFILEIPSDLRNWDKREEILNKLGINFKKLKVPENSQAIEFKRKKIHLTNRSIIIYEKESFIEETAKESKSKAIDHFLKIIKQLERDLQANFSTFGKYHFRVARQHYSLIKNALAKQYNDSGDKLQVYNWKGLWFLIDDSFNLNEAETLHPISAVNDNEKVQNFFNSLKEDPLTTKEIKERFKKISQDQMITSQILEQIDKNIIKITSILGKK